MLRKFTCPTCKRLISISSKMVGATGTCSCGQAFRVPEERKIVYAPLARAQNAAEESGLLKIRCNNCGKELLAPRNAIGKGARCSCGETTPIVEPSVPSRPTMPPQAEAPESEVLMAQLVAPNTDGPDQEERQERQRSSSEVELVRAIPKVVEAEGVEPTKDALETQSSTPFQYLSDNEWNEVAQAQALDPLEEQRRQSTGHLMSRAAKELGEGKRKERASADDYLKTTRDLLIGIGVLRFGLALFGLWVAPSWAVAIAQANQSADADRLLIAMRVIGGLEIGVSILFIICGTVVFTMPVVVTAAITIIFIFMELIGLALNPFSFFNIRAWVFRVLILVGLFQAINNANYYRFIQSQNE